MQLLVICLVIAFTSTRALPDDRATGVKWAGLFEESFLPSYSAVREDFSFFEVEFEEDVYFTPPGKCTTNDVCNETNFARCCSDCPTSSTECVCPSRNDRVCLDSLGLTLDCAFPLIAKICSSAQPGQRRERSCLKFPFCAPAGTQ